MTDRRYLLALTLAWFAIAFHLTGAKAEDTPAPDNVVKFARFKVHDRITFGSRRRRQRPRVVRLDLR